MEIKKSIMIMRVSDHRLRAQGEGRGGVHTGEGRGGDWNCEWAKFIEDHPAEVFSIGATEGIGFASATW